jgi:ParB family chromosome partitioning protein
MALHPTGLGKGLDALIRETHEERESDGIQLLRLEDIVPNPRQPRRNFGDKALEELAASIRSQGLLQPLLVRPLGPASPGKFEIVAGERRWRASRLAGLREVPVLIRTLSAQDTLAAALIENLQREDLNPVEEALGLQKLKEEFGLSQDDLAQKIGKSRPAIANSLRLLTLPENMRPLIAEGKLSAGHARALLSITDARAQEYLKNLILENHLSVREAEGLASGWKEHGVFELSRIAVGDLDAGVEKDEAATSKSSPPGPVPENKDSVPNAGGAKKSRPQSARILEIQNTIGELFPIPVRVTGKETRGKISFAYNSKEELELLLARLTMPMLEGPERLSLSGRQLDKLQGEDRKALDTAERDMLGSMERSALSGERNVEITGADRAQLAESGRTEIAGTDRAKLTGQDLQALRGSSAAAIGQRASPPSGDRQQRTPDSAGQTLADGDADTRKTANVEKSSSSPQGTLSVTSPGIAPNAARNEN